MHHKLFTLIVCLGATIATAWAQTPPDNEIWYTTTDGKKAQLVDEGGLEENGWDFKVISHTYSNGKGVIRANNPIIEYGFVRIEKMLFGLYFSSKTLKTITFPECTEYLYLTDDMFGIDYKLKNHKGLRAINCRYSSEDGRCVVIDGNLVDFAPGGLTELTIPDGVNSIGVECDYDCLGEPLFVNCTSLTSITIPASVTEIFDGSFSGCRNLKNVTVGNLYCLEYFSNLGVPNITYAGPNATADGRCLFSGGTLERFVSTGLTSYDFPARMTDIGSEALNECKNLQSVTVGSYQAYDAFSKAGIPVSAFTGSNASADGRCLIQNGCLEGFMSTGLTSYDFPESVTNVGIAALNECKKLKSVTVADHQPYDAFKKAGIPVSAFTGPYASADGRCLIYNDMLVRFIAAGLTSYDFSERVTKIVPKALYGCKNLKSVTVGSCQAYLAFKQAGIPVSAFTGPNASADGRCLIQNGCLEGFMATGLTSYDFPERVTNIGLAALDECKKLKSVTVAHHQPYDIFKKAGIPVSAFTGSNASADGRCLIINGKLERFIATGLTSYNIPESVRAIAYVALNECRALKSVTVANIQCYDILTRNGISASGFNGSNASADGRCLIINGELTIFISDGATDSVIPQNVTKINDGVFNNCSSLASITCLAMTPPAISDLGIAEETTIYVPKDAIKEYKKDPNWEIYKKQIKAIK